jgi:hypothetical protein
MILKVCKSYEVSERNACLVLGFNRRTVRYQHLNRDVEDEITSKIIELATQYGRYGYRRITAMLYTLGV